MTDSQTDDGVQSSETDDGAGLIERLEGRPYVGVLTRYWMAAAYEHHDERDLTEWTHLGFHALAVALVMIVPVLVSAVVVGQNPALLPADGTLAHRAVDMVGDVYGALLNVPMMVSVMLIFKGVASEIDDSLREVASDG